jgi:SAM-dependent methyltransferase
MQAYGRFAALYDQLMRGVDYDAWAGYIQAFLPVSNLNIVDCACGTGALTLRLARAGHAVTGVDCSPDMLNIAAQKAREAGLRLPFICQDMRRLTLHRPADAIVCACDGVNYLVQPGALEEFFTAAYAALTPGGLLLFDISSRYKLQTVLGGNTFTQEDADCAYIWHNRYDAAKARCHMDLTFFVKDAASGLYERFEEAHLQRAYAQDEIETALQGAGFTFKVYDAFTQNPPKQHGERLQFVAVRNP